MIWVFLKIQIKNYFRLVNSIIGETYFRVSKHLNCLPSEVIRNKFNPDYRFLILRYHLEIQHEIEEAEKIKEQNLR